MTKFNIGDRVVVTTDKYGPEQLGDIGTLYNVTDSCLPYRVKFDQPAHADTNSYEAEDLELLAFLEAEDVSEADYIIVAIDDGAYAPAETPRVFDSEHQAMVVAEKMAKEHDAEFAVFKRVAVLSPEGAEFDEADAVIGGIDFDIVDGAIIWDNDATF